MIDVDGNALRVLTIDGSKDVPPIVLLHDGLGSISLWRDVPNLVAAATGATVVAYERPSHGGSLPVAGGAWPADWLARQAELLGTLLDTVGFDVPVLIGHSDGGSIALIHAATRPARVSAVVALAPHSYVEQVCVDAITGMRAESEPIVAGLARHHDHPGEVFEAWSGGWVSREFAPWDIRPQLRAITVPTWIVQGDTDDYATDAMVHETVAAIGANAVGRIVGGVGHLIPRQSPETVVGLAEEAMRQLH